MFLALFTSSIGSLGILIMTAIACSILGTFLVLRNLAMLSDAISHTILLGIVLGFLITRQVHSFTLVIFAAVFGVITVICIELLLKTGLIKSDAASGIIFPFFFAIAVILISKYARNAHIDVDVVLMGEVIMAPLNKIKVFGLVMPKAFLQMFIAGALNLIYVIIFYKELKLSTFDPESAKLAGFSLVFINYTTMSLVSLNAVTAFDAVGAILVISFFVTPAASAYLITKDLKWMIFVAMLYGTGNSIIGYYLSLFFNVSMSGMVALVAGGTLLITFLLNSNGMITRVWLKYRQRRQFQEDLLVIHLKNHGNSIERYRELGFASIYQHLNWNESKFLKLIKILIHKGIAYQDDEQQLYLLTEAGEAMYKGIQEKYGIDLTASKYNTADLKS